MSVLTTNDFLDVLFAAHYSYLVESEHFPQRGGIMIVAPAESLKTTMVRALKDHGGALNLGDLTSKSFSMIKDQIAGQRWRTVCFDDFATLYRRKMATTKAMIGLLMGLTEEGVTRMHWEAVDGPTGQTARCLVVSGMTIGFCRNHWEAWKGGEYEGFLRRFLWCTFALENPEMLMLAVMNWRRWNLTPHGSFFIPTATLIPHVATLNEAQVIRGWLEGQFSQGAGGATPFKLLMRIFDVLVWVYGKRSGDKELARHEAISTMAKFAQCLRPEGVLLRVEVEQEPGEEPMDPANLASFDLELAGVQQ